VDALEPPTADEWTLCAALHDALAAANPAFDAPLRRAAAARIVDSALRTLDRVAPPEHVGAALARHAWLSRVLDVTRTDTAVSWWTGSRVYRGQDAPALLRLWPELRRVTVVATPRTLLELEPLAISRHKLVSAVQRLLAGSPLTDLATCTRLEPIFAWTDAALALVSTRAGRTLASRALARLPAREVDAALARATGDLAAPRAGIARDFAAG
jgi:hypothetical protein